MGKHLSQHDRETRDLKALELLDTGMTQAAVCERLGMTRGPLVKMLREIRADEAS